MSYSTQRVVSDGSLVLLYVSISYLERSHIKVLFNNVENDLLWNWVGTTDNQIAFSPAVPNGVEVLIARKTDFSAPYHVFSQGAQFTAESLDEDIQQVLFIAQEAAEQGLTVTTGDTNAVLKTSSTGSMKVPAGTTAQRDVSPVYGAQRANSTLNIQEWWNGTSWVAMGGGAEQIGYLPAGTGAVTTDVQRKLRESVSVKDFGAVGDNVTNEVPFFTNAKVNGKPVFIPSGTYKFSTAFDSGDLPMVAVGATLNPQVPATTYFRSYIDLGQKAITRQSIRDVAEYSGTPTSYTYLKTLSSFNILHNNTAGYQQLFTSDSGGRTAVPAIYIEGNQAGYGDVPGVSVHLGVQRHASYASISGAFTGANSGVLFDGEVTAVTNNVNIYGAEFHLGDNTHDRVAANGLVLDFARNNGNPSHGGAYNTVWTGIRLQTSGTYAADSGLSINGKWGLGIDFSGATLSNNAAMALKTNDRIYFGTAATSPPNWWAATLPNNYQTFDGTKYNFVVNGVAALTVAQTEVVSTPIHKFIGSFNVISSGNVASTVGAAGGASALPAAPFTYLKIQIDGAAYKIPVYNN